MPHLILSHPSTSLGFSCPGRATASASIAPNAPAIFMPDSVSKNLHEVYGSPLELAAEVCLRYHGVGQLCPSPNPCISMSTAISRIYTPEGFVIAADGRSADARDYTMALNDSTQKIFGFNRPNRQLAYTICGTVVIANWGTGQPAFSFESDTAVAMDRLMESSTSKSLWHFAVEVMNEILPSILRAKESRKAFPAEFPTKESTTLITIDGYYHGRAESARIEFRHHGILERDTTESVSSEEQNDKHDCGSPQVLGMLEREAESLSDFRPSRRRENMTIREAIQVANNRVRAQCSAIAREISPQCRAMGGDIHIVTVTPERGVEWVDGFKPGVLSYPIRA